MAINDSTGQPVPQLDTQTGAPQSSGSSTSLFNAFYVFKYSGGVDKIEAQTYASNNQRDRNGAKANVISNPTASAIVEWASKIPENSKDNQYGIKNSPYAWADFLFCRWYGIVPNNRLVTLRKFPLGSNDDAGVLRKNKPQNIPVAQAVTWFGGPTGNDINSIWQSTWSLAWKKEGTTAKDVQGNEFVNFSQQLVEAIPAGANPFVKGILTTLADTVEVARSNAGLEAVGKATLEDREQEYIKGLWSDNGAFFNQIQGPVNVKNQFLFRDRGLSNTAPDAMWQLVFEYRTDSYFGMSQRRVGLDIIANMLALTYSDGEWLESLNVYYKKLGLNLGGSEQLLIEGAYKNGTFNPKELLAAILTIGKTRVADIVAAGVGAASSAVEAAGTVAGAAVTSLFAPGSTVEAIAKAYDSMSDEKRNRLNGLVEVQLTKALADSFPKFLQQRANVAGTPTGNWHLTIGNPMNPIMRIGDVVVRSCKLDFGEELGADDFPLDLKFTVTLSPTKPRDGADIRRTFNSGRIDYIEGLGGATLDQVNTYGVNSKALTELSTSTNAAETEAARAKLGEDFQASSSNASQDAVENWLASRYGPGMVDPTYLQQVYFYKPVEEKIGGAPTAR
jgi:hypothetical protein